jgi:hypothetical protein
MPDNAGTGADIAIDSAGTHGRDAVHEFGLADRFEGLRPVGAIHRPALDEHAGADIVAAPKIGEQLVEEIARRSLDDFGEAMERRRKAGEIAGRAIPEMMMRIDDRQIRIEDRLG